MYSLKNYKNLLTLRLKANNETTAPAPAPAPTTAPTTEQTLEGRY
jgi:hypothetical protein